MLKITLNIEGMGCPRCEKKIDDAVKNAFGVESVKSSHTGKTTVITAPEEISREALAAVIEPLGFTVTGYRCKKKGFWLFG